MEAQICSQCYVKPYTPTPRHLKTHNLSLLDLLQRPHLFGLALFYPNNHQEKTMTSNTQERSSILKHSLSKILSQFYPLAGNIKDDFSIDCDDEGVYYVEARSNYTLSEYLNQTNEDFSLLRKFLPVKSSLDEPISRSHVLMVQETTFTCGGLAICVFFSHQITDANSACFFLKAWAASAKADNEGKEKEMLADFEALPAMFPQNEAVGRMVNSRDILKYFARPTTEKGSMRRFLFNGSAIARLKDEIAACMGVNVVPTRVGAVSALLWKRIMAISQAKHSDGARRATAIGTAINLRRRAIPPIPESSFGNFVGSTYSVCTEENPSLSSLVCLLRESIAKVDSNFVKNQQDTRNLTKGREAIKEISASHKDINGIIFTSWCNFGFYKVDFGWGKPAWVTPVNSDNGASPFNVVVLLDTGVDKGVEALVDLEKEELIMLEHDKEFLAYASVVTNPLNYA